MSDDTRRVGIFGGSFNPPHVAHVLAAAYTLLVAPIDELWVIPVYQHPFSKELAPFEKRLAMCQLAFAGLPGVHVSDVERELGGESRTLRTLEHLQGAHPRWAMRLVIGSDVVADLPKWHQFDRIALLAPPFVLERHGSANRPDRALLPAVSSTEIRDLFRAGRVDELALLMPQTVLDFARSEGLYAAAFAAGSSSAKPSN